jgi:hypothetical protein
MKTIHAGLIVLTSSLLTAIDVHPTAAEVYRPWCVQYLGSRAGATNCSFISYQQCRMTATPGSGGICVQNPWYVWYGSGSQHIVGRGRTRR